MVLLPSIILRRPWGAPGAFCPGYLELWFQKAAPDGTVSEQRLKPVFDGGFLTRYIKSNTPETEKKSSEYKKNIKIMYGKNV